MTTQNTRLFAPLRLPTFRRIWMAAFGARIALWMMQATTAWMMTDLSSSPVLIGAVQSAFSLPGVLVAYLGGALADIIDRRKFLLWVTAVQIGTTAALAALDAGNLLTAQGLLVMVFVFGVGNVFILPAMNAIIYALVDRDMVLSAVSLNSMSANAARSVGPAMAGLIIGSVGYGPAFGAMIAAYLWFAGSLWLWEGENPGGVPARKKRLGRVLIAGLRYMRRSRAFRSILLHAFLYFICTSALMSMLPVLARFRLGLDAAHFGSLLLCFGLGAIGGAMLTPGLMRRMARGRIMLLLSIATGLVMIAVAHTSVLPVMWALLVAMGILWVSVLMLLQSAAQLMLPPRVRARGLSTMLMMMMFSSSAGGLLWGAISKAVGLAEAMTLAGTLAIVFTLLAARLPIGRPGN